MVAVAVLVRVRVAAIRREAMRKLVRALTVVVVRACQRAARLARERAVRLVAHCRVATAVALVAIKVVPQLTLTAVAVAQMTPLIRHTAVVTAILAEAPVVMVAAVAAVPTTLVAERSSLVRAQAEGLARAKVGIGRAT